MTWFGGPAYLITAVVVFTAVLLLDRWLLYIGLIERNHRRVPHRKLRAIAEARRMRAAECFGKEATKPDGTYCYLELNHVRND